jgi:hypothetical protein
LKIDVETAREYFAHPTQQKGSMVTPERLPEAGVIYAAKGGVCVCFHDAHWPGVAMVHHAVKPEVWGKADAPALEILHWFCGLYKPETIIGWTKESNRAALAFARRLGFEEYGRLELPSGAVIKQRWKSWA